MTKDAYYFSHDSNARQDDKIIALRMKHNWEGYGLFWAIIEKLRDASDYSCIKDYNIIGYDLRVDASKIKSIIEDFGLFDFSEDGKYFYSISLFNRMNVFDDVKKKASISGIRGNLIRHKHLTKKQSDAMSDEEILSLNLKIKGDVATRPQPDRNPVAIKEEEIRGKEIKLEEKKEKAPEKFSSSSASKILSSKEISIDQWSIIFHIPKEDVLLKIKEFCEYKERHSEMTWKNETDLTKNFEFWLQKNANQKNVSPQKTINNGFKQNRNR